MGGPEGDTVVDGGAGGGVDKNGSVAGAVVREEAAGDSFRDVPGGGGEVEVDEALAGGRHAGGDAVAAGLPLYEIAFLASVKVSFSGSKSAVATAPVSGSVRRTQTALWVRWPK